MQDSPGEPVKRMRLRGAFYGSFVETQVRFAAVRE